MKNYIFTSESVTEGHPDKVCDQIADAILDAALEQDPYSNMAVECTIKDDFVLIYGEANTKANIDYAAIALAMIKKIGYEEEYHVHVVVNQQSPEIHNAVNRDDVCAGDQGIMFGYACDESREYMPLPIYYAHKLAMQLAKVRKKNPKLKPDGKTQVSVEYENDEIKRIDTIVVSTQHAADVSQEEIKEIVMNEVIKPCINEKLLDENTKYFINPSGSFVIGGSFGDSGTTGRKIVCDTYGGRGRIGGGCFSKSKTIKTVGRISVLPAFFGISEPVTFGLPMMLNPIFFVPCAMVPTINALISYICMSTNLIDKTFAMLSFNMPSVFGSFLSTGDMKALVLVVVLLIIDMILYYPFLKMYEKQQLKLENSDISESEME